MQEQFVLVALDGSPAPLPIASESKSTNKHIDIDWECFIDQKISGMLQLKHSIENLNDASRKQLNYDFYRNE